MRTANAAPRFAAPVAKSLQIAIASRTPLLVDPDAETVPGVSATVVVPRLEAPFRRVSFPVVSKVNAEVPASVRTTRTWAKSELRRACYALMTMESILYVSSQ